MSGLVGLFTTPLSRGRRRAAIAVVTATVIGAGVIVATRKSACGCGSKPRSASFDIAKYAWDALPNWRADTGRLCPPDLSALNVYRNNDDVRDPWGRPYAFLCLVTSGRAVGFVASAGEDREFGTDDDLIAGFGVSPP
ncbi:MAG: hypothetical protein K8W52_38470 [Deltaproteobacteria bacterium]|nr:hypothetical protein [Deltaproteobacteria bacterium]